MLNLLDSMVRRMVLLCVAIALLIGGGSALGQVYSDLELEISHPLYIRSEGALLYLHAFGGSNPDAQMTLHPCPKQNQHVNCRWILELSPSRPGAYYIRSEGALLYLHAFGGSNPDAPITLHPCPKENDHPNCQWFVLTSPTRPGAYYIRTAGAPLYLHAFGGSNPDALETLHPCPEVNDHPNCQWVLELP